VTRSKFQTEGPHTLGAALQTLIFMLGIPLFCTNLKCASYALHTTNCIILHRKCVATCFDHLHGHPQATRPQIKPKLQPQISYWISMRSVAECKLIQLKCKQKDIYAQFDLIISRCCREYRRLFGVQACDSKQNIYCSKLAGGVCCYWQQQVLCVLLLIAAGAVCVATDSSRCCVCCYW
jgi:hypothetical protein